nr:hypothetical protein [Armatimonas sp.]
MVPQALLFDPDDVEMLVVCDAFLGLTEHGHNDFTATLKHKCGDYHGEAIGQIGLSNEVRLAWPAVLTTAVSQSCFALLITADLHDQPYQPHRPYDDVYPSRRIEISTSQGLIIFHTDSLGKYMIPWRVNIANQDYISHNEVLGEAWNYLHDALHIGERTEELFHTWNSLRRPKTPKRKTLRSR